MVQPRQGVQQPNYLTDAELKAYRKQQDEEWGEWIADPAGGGILHEGALAYAPGSAVPKSNVEKYGYDKDGQVVKAPKPGSVSAPAVAPEPKK